MKKTKKILLGIVLAGILMTAAGGTYSWFTSETSANGEMVNGTLQINNGEDIEEPMFSGVQFSPSQLQYGNWITITNSGDLDAFLKTTYSHTVDKASLESYDVGFMAMKYTTTPDQDVYEQSKIALENLFNGTTNERNVTLSSLPDGVQVTGKVLTADEADSGEIVFGEGEEDSFWKLKEGQYIDIMVGVKLDEHAGNEYQGATYDASLQVKAKQTDSGAQYE